MDVGFGNWIIDVNQDARIRSFVDTRDRDCSRTGGPSTRHSELCTGNIELSTTGGTRAMESNVLNAKQIVSRRNRPRNGKGKLGSIVIRESDCVTTISFGSRLPDFEPP